MKIVNRQPVRTADVSSNRGEGWRELWRLTIYAALLIVGVYFSVGWIVDQIVPSISVEQEAALFSNMKWSKGKAIDEDVRLEAARKILEQLVLDSEVPKLPYHLFMVENPKPNAFAFPGGGIGVTSGLIDTLDSEAALRFVLGHELGHFHQRDHLRGFGRAVGSGVAFAVIFGGEMGRGQWVKTWTHVLSRSYSRQQEEGADLFGISLVSRVYGETEGCEKLFRIIQEMGELPAWAYMLSTHPSPTQRIQQLKEASTRLRNVPSTVVN